MSPKAKAYLALALGVFMASWASILVRWANTDRALVVAAGRMVLTSLILTPVALATGVPRQLRALGWKGLLLALLSGLALAVHFAAWFFSLLMTTVASSVVLMSTHPLFVALGSRFILRERITRLTLLGVSLSLAGTILVGYGDFGLSQRRLLGDLLALVGGLMAAAYFLLGRRLRQRLSVLAYIWPVYSTAALVLLVTCLVTRQPFLGYAPVTYWMIVLLAVGPQILGHSSLNYALEHLSATFVTVAVLGEPLGSSLFAYLFLNETPRWTALAGGALILGGIVLAGRGEQRSRT